jgi:hypothetical protein
MKKIGITIIFFVLTLCTCNGVLAQQEDVLGWNKTRWGITEKEVVELFAGKAQYKSSDQKIKLCQEGCSPTIEIDDFKIGSSKYHVCFCMDNVHKTLKEIKISYKFKGPNEFDVSEYEFLDLEDRLKEKYDSPSYEYNSRPEDKELHIKFERVWRFPSTIITLMYDIDKKANIKLFYIHYLQGNKADPDNK